MAVYLGSNKVGPSFTTEKPDDQYGFLKNSQLIKTVTYDLPLSSTNFSSLTISTTSQNLTLPATTYTTTPSTTITVAKSGEDYDGIIIDRANHDYVVIGEGYWTYVYTQNEATMNTMIHGIKSGMCKDSQTGWYYQINTDGTLKTTPSFTSGYCTGQCYHLYRKVNGQYATISTYGINVTGASASFSTSNNKDYIDFTLGSATVRAHASYFPVDAMNYIDPNNMTLHFIWKVYEGDKNVVSTIYKTVYNYIALS